ncbi:hypothetical protein ACJJTC_006130 [Scirpophaga incertulas]
MKKVYLLIVCVIGIVICAEIDFKGFDDTILFGINWPGVTENLGNAADEGLDNLRVLNKETLNVITPDKEKYQCLIPEFPTKETSNIEEYDGPSPMNLLKPLFAQKICSYRLDSYWSYEVCHGRYIRQYHDERDGKAVKTQEYYLGNWSPEKQLKRDAEQKEQKPEFKTTTVEGLMLPYVEMIFDDGTICDLNGNARTTRVKYVCYAHGRHELYSFKEVATCEYEIIILSPLLCEHPTYKPREVSENIIDCIPMLGAPKKPQSLLKSEFDILKFQHQSIRFQNNDKELKDVLAVTDERRAGLTRTNLQFKEIATPPSQPSSRNITPRGSAESSRQPSRQPSSERPVDAPPTSQDASTPMMLKKVFYALKPMERSASLQNVATTSYATITGSPREQRIHDCVQERNKRPPKLHEAPSTRLIDRLSRRPRHRSRSAGHPNASRTPKMNPAPPEDRSGRKSMMWVHLK